MGLTGLILWAEIELKRIHNPTMEAETIRFAGIDDFFELSAESAEKMRVCSLVVGRRKVRSNACCEPETIITWSGQHFTARVLPR